MRRLRTTASVGSHDRTGRTQQQKNGYGASEQLLEFQSPKLLIFTGTITTSNIAEPFSRAANAAWNGLWVTYKLQYRESESAQLAMSRYAVDT
jgi:hypothetical protein